MIKRGFIYASIFWCGRRICSVKSLEWYIVCGLVGLGYACSYTSFFIINSCFELMVNYVGIPMLFKNYWIQCINIMM